MIAFIGILFSILFTSDFILESLQKLIFPIFIYWKTGQGSFSLLSMFVFLSLSASLFFLGWCILLLFDSLSGKTVCSEDSLLFFGKIQHNSNFQSFYEKFDTITEGELLKDRLRQIYNCSKRCTDKFRSYNKAILMAKLAVLSLCLFMISLLVFNSIS